jgi:predicted ester cyclase
MIEENKFLAREWFEQVWNQRNEDVIDRVLHPQGKCYGFPEPDGVIVGPDAFKAAHRIFCGAFPDLHLEIEEIIAEDYHVAVRWKSTMTHRGGHLGFPATGRTGELRGASFMIADGRQILSGWNYMDLQALYNKLRA